MDSSLARRARPRPPASPLVPRILPPLDTSLLAGVSFGCRPDCGLCCYTTPAVDGSEAERLITLDPATPLEEGDGTWWYVGSRGNGGACHFLRSNRCEVHAERPFSCREFPISVHLGSRAQATVVLSCPGVARPGWTGSGDRSGAGPPTGLDLELATVQEEYERRVRPEHLELYRRKWDRLGERRRSRGRWTPPEEIRDELGEVAAEIALERFPPEPPPAATGPVEELPIVFVPGTGLVALADRDGRVELTRLEESGVRSRSLGSLPPPEVRPDLSPAGRRALSAYLEHLLARDLTYWAAAETARSLPDADLLEIVEDDLGHYGASVLARAELLRRHQGTDPGPLSADDVWEGVRATDGEVVDRPTLGKVL